MLIVIMFKILQPITAKIYRIIFIKEVLVPAGGEKVLPCGGIKGILTPNRKDTGEPVIKHHMKLGRDFPCLWIQDKRHQSTVMWSESNKEAAARLVFPFWKWFKNKCRAAPDMHVFEVSVGCIGMLQESQRGKHPSRGTWHVVVMVESIINSHGPQSTVSLCWPANRCMDQQGSCLSEDCLDSSLSNVILADTAEFHVLYPLLDFTHEGRGSKNSIVKLIGLDCDAQIIQSLFKSLFCMTCFGCGKIY